MVLGKKWKRMDEEMYGSSLLLVFINGSSGGYFKCSRDLRHGDTLSPFLF